MGLLKNYCLTVLCFVALVWGMWMILQKEGTSCCLKVENYCPHWVFILFFLQRLRMISGCRNETS